MDNQEVLKAIANLADKVSRYHERLLAVERDHIKHVQGCTCQKEVATGKDYPKEYIEERVGEARETLCEKPDLLLIKNNLEDYIKGEISE